MDFIVLMEVWKDDKIQYANADMKGDYLPKQTDGEARAEITEMLNGSLDGVNVLDIIGVYHKGEEVWQD